MALLRRSASRFSTSRCAACSALRRAETPVVPYYWATASQPRARLRGWAGNGIPRAVAEALQRARDEDPGHRAVVYEAMVGRAAQGPVGGGQGYRRRAALLVPAVAAFMLIGVIV